MEVDFIQRPRREKRLPNVLSKEEVKSILEAPTNLKHRAMLSLIYTCGLRRSELLNLTLKDVLSDRKLLFIQQSKGKKDRVVPIGNKLIEMLRDYYKAHKPKTWLFEGQFPNTKYSEKSLENVLKQSLTKTKICTASNFYLLLTLVTYSVIMIKGFGDKESEKIWNGIRSKKLPSEIQNVARRKLRMMNNAQDINDLRIPPANRLEKLKGDMSKYHSIRINNQWRIIFEWKNNDAYDVSIVDYH